LSIPVFNLPLEERLVAVISDFDPAPGVQGMAFLIIALFSAPPADERYACLLCSYAFGKQFAIAVPERALQKTPKWEKGAPNPPLAARKAMDIANQAKVRLIPDDSKGPLLFKRASLVPLAGTWTWNIEYEARDRGTPPANLLLVVLMDGTLVEPIVSPDPYAPASGGK
jgi:hypothetical protein